MTPAPLDPAVIADRASWIRTMLAGIASLPIESFDAFSADPRNAAAAESYLRRAIEALVDLGRHVLAKRFAVAVSEYKAIPGALAEARVIDERIVPPFVKICGYRNRMVHFYHAVSDQDLFSICTRHVEDIEQILAAMLTWIDEHGNGDADGDRIVT